MSIMSFETTELEKNILNELEDFPYNMKPKDIAKYLNMSVSSVYSLVKDTHFPSYKISRGHILIKKSLFAKWYSEQLCSQ